MKIMENINGYMFKRGVFSKCCRSIVIAGLMVAIPTAAFAQPKKGSDGASKEGDADAGSSAKESEKVVEQSSVTHGKVDIGEVSVRYKATAATIQLEKSGKRPAASIFYVAYEREGVKNRSKRPVTFCFNGGPGSSSVWLHLGAFGPDRVKLSKDGTHVPAPPYRLVSNPYSLLDVTDLVFIDPVSTGYSRAEKPEEAKSFHGFQEDIDSVAEFVRLYVTREGRWASPKYLAGESYGAIRASGLASALQGRFGMYLNGVIIVSGVWDFSTLMARSSNDLPYMLFLPTMTAVAHYHGVLKGDMAALVAEAEEFALGDYALALHRGNSLEADEKRKIAAKLSKLTGIKQGLIEDAGLRISSSVFRKELLRERGETVGRFDGRMIGHDAVQLGMSPMYDPSFSLIYGAYSSTLNQLVRGKLGFESDLPYEILSRQVRPWNYDGFTNRYVSVADHVSDTLRSNKDIRYFIACGHYDLATPQFGIDYTINHLEMAPGLRKNFEFGFYEGGHMMYTNVEALGELKADLGKFIRGKK